AHLQPTVTLRAGSDLTLAEQLHVTAHHKCFIANSVNFPITCTPNLVVEPAAT
ncbi:MAG: OsmC family peroxiredoxin, partial [Pseudomonadota bacterium]|nr:OsmC family peroxiredoxin [Pseudomonadota bacterium]